MFPVPLGSIGDLVPVQTSRRLILGLFLRQLSVSLSGLCLTLYYSAFA